MRQGSSRESGKCGCRCSCRPGLWELSRKGAGHSPIGPSHSPAAVPSTCPSTSPNDPARATVLPLHPPHAQTPPSYASCSPLHVGLRGVAGGAEAGGVHLGALVLKQLNQGLLRGRWYEGVGVMRGWAMQVCVLRRRG